MQGAACNKSCIVQGLLLLVPEPGDQLSSLRPKLPLVVQAHLIKVHLVRCLRLSFMHEQSHAAWCSAEGHIAPRPQDHTIKQGTVMTIPEHHLGS